MQEVHHQGLDWNQHGPEIIRRWQDAYWAIDLAFERMKEAESVPVDPDSIP